MQLDLRKAAQEKMPHLVLSKQELPLRDMAIRTWTGRMVNEHGSARVFEGLYHQFAELGLEDQSLERIRSFADDERRHGVLCGAVVEALGGTACASELPQEEYPQHLDATPLEAALRNLMSISCLSETVAVALIGAEREEMPEGELKELLTRIYADECAHANFGWRLLGQLMNKEYEQDSESAKELGKNLGHYLTVAFAHLEAHELAHLPLESNPPPEGGALGLCSGASARTLFYATVTQIIVPGLEAMGIPAQWAWEHRAK
ncbi:MAG: hypothetical protein CMK59_08125 [Proteobacteria bacterium]|nr:hypothetical protein [Pseudomonadota bacterium]